MILPFVDQYGLLLTNTAFGPRPQSIFISVLPLTHFPDTARWRRQRYQRIRGRGPHRYTRGNHCGVPAVLRRVLVRRDLKRIFGADTQPGSWEPGNEGKIWEPGVLAGAACPGGATGIVG